mgnify:CR=1 FL=1
MESIWVFPVFVGDFTLNMPLGAEVLSTQVQNGQPVLWAKVDTGAPIVERRFAVRGTGHQLTGDEGNFVGTFQFPNLSLVYHLFEERI